MTTENFQSKHLENLLSQVDPKKARIELSRRFFKDFVLYTKPDYSFNWHHEEICRKLEAFAFGDIKKLMLFVPPQHGKSELATRRLPPYLLGLKPSLKVAICSYSATLAASFNRDIQRVIDDKPYYEVFPETRLNASNVSNDAHGAYLRNSEIFETINHRGFVKTVGVGGSLTGTPVDIGIIDDPFKDREEAMSPKIRDKVYSWYTDVFQTRMHNSSQELIIMTRWHTDDLAGRVLKSSGSEWEVVTFQGIKEREVAGDPRKVAERDSKGNVLYHTGEALWPEKHSIERLLKVNENSPVTFNSLYQQNPKVSKEILVYPEWHEYTDEEEPDTEQLIGLDFGFSNDPNAIVGVKIKGRNMYVKELLYENALTNSGLSFRMSLIGLKTKRIVADSSEPKTIEEFKREKGYNIIGAVKGPDSVINGISWVKDFKLFVHAKSHNLKNELNSYQWVMVGGIATNVPIDKDNHLLDALRYTKTLIKSGKNKAAVYG